MLFELATWHAFAKLRLHTETTLNDLENSTTRLGEVVRKFEKKVCCDYRTKELSTELAARTRRQVRKAKSQTSSTSLNIQRTGEKKFNMNTYKFHALGDYVASIRLFGTTDGYTSQLVCVHMARVLFTNLLNRVNSSIGV